MIFGKVQRFKIVVIVLDVGAAGDLETQAVKNIDDLVDHQRERMDPAALQAAAGKRDVDFSAL